MPDSKSTFIFVHGGFHGGWSWERVTPYLNAQGHKTLTPDLPGHGDDKTPQEKITYNMALEHIAKLILPELQPAILVGHSMSGLIISALAEHYPDRIKMLVYIGAFLTPSGYSLKSYLDTHQDIGINGVLPNTTPSGDDTHVIFNNDKAYEIFYNTTPKELADISIRRLKPVARVYLRTPVFWSAENFGRVPRTYIACSKDHALPIALQRNMYTELPCEKVIEMPSDHSPFECMPEILSEYLLDAANEEAMHV